MSTTHATDQQRIRANQAGMVSIMVTMVLMIVISLIVLGFAQISRRNQRQALDRQLSTQAFYAAESGVNDVRNIVQQRLAASQPIDSKTSCQDDGTSHSYSALVGSSSNVLDPPTGLVKYTCLLVDPNPTSLDYSDVGTTSTIVPLQAANGTITSLNLTWRSKTGSTTPTNNCPTSTNKVFSDTGSWQCGYGVMRFDLVRTDSAQDAQGLMQGTMTSFVVPLTTGASAAIPFQANTSNTNNVVGTKCSDSGCSLSINSGLGGSQYYLRIRSVYQNASLEINGSGSAGTVHFTGAQAVVDATGKANDVLRRIQVHMPLQNSSESNLPDYALESTDSVCKRFSVYSGYFKNQVPVNSSDDNPLCQL